MPGSLFNKIRIVAATVTIVAGVVRIIPYFDKPEVIFATKDINTYPLAFADGNLPDGTIEARITEGKPIKILGLAVQNKGSRTATDVLVRLPFTTADGYLGGWIARGDDPITHYMQVEKTEYKIDKLIPEESVSFFIYLREMNSDIADRIVVTDGLGKLARHYPYLPVRNLGEQSTLIVVPSWLFYFGVIVLVLFLLPNPADARKWVARVRAHFDKAADQDSSAPPTSRYRKAKRRRK